MIERDRGRDDRSAGVVLVVGCAALAGALAFALAFLAGVVAWMT